jgi:putative transposase
MIGTPSILPYETFRRRLRARFSPRLRGRLHRRLTRTYGQTFKRHTANCGVRTIQISQPQCNCYVERLMRTLRQECLRHLIILDEKHLRSVLEQFLAYYHRSRPHQGLNQETPLPQPRLLSSDAIVRSRPVLGGLHHEYFRAAA